MRERWDMYLFIDTHAAGTVRFAWLSPEGKNEELVFEGRASELLTKLAHHFKTRSGKLSGIALTVGPGSFSAVRVGVLYGNLLARFLGVPLYPLSVEEGRDLASLSWRLAKGEIAAARFAAPVYDAEPNITLPKRA